jgi:SAM-dependent methyltransferase
MSSRKDESFGARGTSIVDRFGVWLSQRAIQKAIQNKESLEVLDLGCGYRASQLTAMASRLKRAVGVDFQIASELKGHPHLQFHECEIEAVFPRLEKESFDLVLMISVLEHLANPAFVLREVHSVLKPTGILLVNVPTWSGKFFLEFSAFRLGLSPKIEMDDHKMYYSKRDLWPLLVQAGFKPSQIHLSYHKFGLNLFAKTIKNFKNEKDDH